MVQGHNPGKFLSAPLLAALTVSVATTKVNYKNQSIFCLPQCANINMRAELVNGNQISFDLSPLTYLPFSLIFQLQSAALSKKKERETILC